jgi:hypothetical protein
LLALCILGCRPRYCEPEDKPDAPTQAEKKDKQPLTPYPDEFFNSSLVQILANRDKYDGKVVQVEGFLHVRFEDKAIYLSKESADYGMTRNGFWVTFDKKAVPYEGEVGPKQFDKKYVLIEGRFNKKSRGHLGLFQGAIENVDRVLELDREK